MMRCEDEHSDHGVWDGDVRGEESKGATVSTLEYSVTKQRESAVQMCAESADDGLHAQSDAERVNDMLRK